MQVSFRPCMRRCAPFIMTLKPKFPYYLRLILCELLVQHLQVRARTQPAIEAIFIMLKTSSGEMRMSRYISIRRRWVLLS